MMNQNAVSSSLIPEPHRVKVTSDLFGLDFPLRLEPYIFGLARQLSTDYHGGYWEFYRLSNRGFYMTPERDQAFWVISENGFSGQLSPEAFGIVVCLYAYSGLSFGEDPLAEACTEQYHLLREFAIDHNEARSIVAATD